MRTYPKIGEIWRQKRNDAIQMVKVFIIAVYAHQVIVRAAEGELAKVDEPWTIAMSWFLTYYRKQTKLEGYMEEIDDGL